MRRRTTSLFLVLALGTMLSTSLSGTAGATPRGFGGGDHVATHGASRVNHRTGLPIGTLPTKGQLKRAARTNSSSYASAAQQNSSASYQLSYYGGPIVSNIQVKPVLWGSGTYIPQVSGSISGSPSPNMQTFFQSITKTPYAGWLSEYNTTAANVSGGTGQQIGAGSVLPATPINPASPANGSIIDDQQIQQELLNQIVAGTLPQPTLDTQGYENTTYALYFPSGVKICQDAAGTICSDNAFCGYHGSFTVFNSSNQPVGDVRYIVLPDTSSSVWLSGCSSNAANTAFTGLEAVASHELAEVITDPEVAEVTGSNGPPLGWYDGTGTSTDPGEIADICDTAQYPNQDTPLTGTDGQSYVLEDLWSNRVGQCGITTPPTSAGSPTATPRAGGAIGLAWTAPTISGGLPVSYDIYATPNGDSATMVATTSTTSWTSGALTSGTSYVFTVVARNSSGSASGVTTTAATADGTSPTVHLTGGPSAFTLTSTTKFTYTATDTDSPSGITYDVAYKAAAWNGSWGSLNTLAHATTATSASLTLRPGYEYCLVVRARDQVGNVSAWTAPRCTSAPLDDRSLATKTTGWTRATTSAAYRGTVTKTGKAGAKLGISGVIANSLGLVVATCPTCGNVQIWLGSTLWKTVSTKSSTLQYKRLLLPGTFSLRTTAVVIRVASGQGVIDGLGVIRPAPTF